MLKKKLSLMILPILVFSTAFIGCSDDDETIVASPAQASVRVIHASYDAPAVDVRVDGSVAVSSLDYGISSGYAVLNSGTRSVQVSPAGATTPVVIDVDLPLASNNAYTVFAFGELSTIEATAVQDDRTTVTNKAKVRFVHGSPDAPAVDIKLNSGSGPAVFSNRAFKSVSDYAQVDAASYTFVVTATGSTDEVVKFNPIAVQNGNVYTVVALGTLDPNDAYPFQVRVFVDNGSGDQYVDLSFATSRVLTVHASPGTPGVDLLIDNVVKGTNLTYPSNTGYATLDAGTRNVKVNVTGTSTTAIEANLTLDAGVNYSVFAADTGSGLGAVVLVDDLAAPAAGTAHVRFVHLSPDAPAVDVALTGGGVVFGDKAFKQYTAFTPLAAGTYDLEVRVAGTSTVVLPLPGITLQAGKIYTVFAKGFAFGAGSSTYPLGAEIIVNN